MGGKPFTQGIPRIRRSATGKFPGILRRSALRFHVKQKKRFPFGEPLYRLAHNADKHCASTGYSHGA